MMPTKYRHMALWFTVKNRQRQQIRGKDKPDTGYRYTVRLIEAAVGPLINIYAKPNSQQINPLPSNR